MAQQLRLFTDRDVDNGNRWQQTLVSGTTYDLTPVPGTIRNEGTPLLGEYINKIQEAGVYTATATRVGGTPEVFRVDLDSGNTFGDFEAQLIIIPTTNNTTTNPVIQFQGVNRTVVYYVNGVRTLPQVGQLKSNTPYLITMRGSDAIMGGNFDATHLGGIQADAFVRNDTTTPQNIEGNLKVDNTGLSGSASISLAIGDSDTGFNWVSDGNFQMYANNTAVATITSSGVAFENKNLSNISNVNSNTITTNQITLDGFNINIIP